MADAAAPPPRSILHNRNFILLWCAYGISAMGDHLSEMAILQTQNALDPGVDATPLDARMTFLMFVPFFLLAPISGFLADRLPRRGLMIFADLVRCVVLFFFLQLITWTTPAGTWGPFLPLILVGVFASLFAPARLALLPTIIHKDQLVRANGMLAGLGIIATMAAMFLGGILADRYAATFAFRIDAATYLTSAVFLSLMVLPRGKAPITDTWVPAFAGMTEGAAHKPSSVGDLAGDLARGFRYVLGHRRVMELAAVSALVWFCGPLVKCVMPAIVRDVYHGSFKTIGEYRAILGGGFIVGAILITVLGNALRSEIAITWGLFGIGLSIAAFAASVFLPVGASVAGVIGGVAIFGAGMFAVSVMASFHTLFQRIVPDRFRGRVFGVNELCSNGALLLATGSLGIPAWTRVDRWVGYILIAVAIVTIAAGVVTLHIRIGRSTMGRAMTFAENLNEFVARFWYRLQIEGRPTVPRTGPVIVTANHVSPPDPLLIHAAARYRPISFMVAEEYTHHPVAKFVVNLAECIPVRRDGQDTAATKKAIRHLRDGKAVGIFIEGRIIPPGETGHPQDGVAMLALRTGAPVIPAFISGMKYQDGVVRGLLSRHRARVRFGPAVDLDEFRAGKADRATIRQASARIYEAINSLAPPSFPRRPHRHSREGGNPVPTKAPPSFPRRREPSPDAAGTQSRRGEYTAQSSGASRMNRIDLWDRYRKYFCRVDSIGLSLDVSRMTFDDGFIESMQPRMCDALAAMDALEAGAIANADENRMVGHYWLRAPERAPESAITREIEQSVEAVRKLTREIHEGALKPQRGDGFFVVLLIGIGGSALGPQLLADALGSQDDPMLIRFLDNTDPDGIDRLLAEIDDNIESTLTIVISKSGGTKETRNAMLEVAEAYRSQGLDFARHAVAITQQGSALHGQAVEEKWLRTLPMWDWVGGRTSVTSAVGLLPAALVGIDIDGVLSGARACDEATRNHHIADNPAALMALMWHHAGGGRGERNMVVLPYCDRLALFGKYLQQLIMESLGKRLDRAGEVVHQGLTVYGNKGSTDQHAYVQQLRDGRADFFATFIEVLRLREGPSIEVDPGMTTGDYLFGFMHGTREALTEAGRPSMTLTLDRPGAASMGVLIALFERAVGLYAELINVNAYHQPGVEAGKKAAGDILDRQARVLRHLRDHQNQSWTAEALAAALGSLDAVETIHHILVHLAADPSRGITREGGGPIGASFRFKD